MSCLRVISQAVHMDRKRQRRGRDHMPTVPTHHEPGVVFLSSVPRAHIGHTTHKSRTGLLHLLKCKMV